MYLLNLYSMATSILGQTAVRAAKLEVVTELPEIGKKNQIYLVPNKSSVSGDIYDEYIWINDTWEFLGNKSLELTIDSNLKPDSANPVENSAIYWKFLGVNKDIEVNRNNIVVLTGRVNEVDGIAKGAEELTKVNEKRLNGIQATVNETKVSVEGLTTVTKRMEVNISQLQELNVVYSNKIRNLTTESTLNEIQNAFEPVEPDNGSISIVFPHVGYLIKGNKNSDDQDNQDSTIISVEIVKIDNKDCHKFMYIDNNRDLVTMTVYLAGITDCKVIERSVVSNINTIVDKINTFDKKFSSGTLRDLYISAGAKYNEATGYYELNGLTDITEEQMRVIWQEDLSGWYRKGRTNLTRNIAYKGQDGGYSDGQKMSNICNENTNLEVFNLGSDFYASSSFVAFSGCTKLREVLPQYKIVPYARSLGYNIFNNCPALQEVRFNMQYVTGGKVLFSESPLLSKESVLSIITTMGSVPKENPFTITLHPTAYARLKDDADIVAALEAKGGVITLVSA